MAESLYRPAQYCVGFATDPQPEDKLRYFDWDDAIAKARHIGELHFNQPVAVWNCKDEIRYLILCGQEFRPNP